MKKYEREHKIVLEGAVQMMRWYHAGYTDAAKGKDRWLEVPPRFPEDRMMYHDGQDDQKAGRPNKVLAALEDKTK